MGIIKLIIVIIIIHNYFIIIITIILIMNIEDKLRRLKQQKEPLSTIYPLQHCGDHYHHPQHHHYHHPHHHPHPLPPSLLLHTFTPSHTPSLRRRHLRTKFSSRNTWISASFILNSSFNLSTSSSMLGVCYKIITINIIRIIIITIVILIIITKILITIIITKIMTI